MNKKLVKNAIEALERWNRNLAVDANLCDMFQADYPLAIKASEQRKLNLETIKELNNLLKAPELF